MKPLILTIPKSGTHLMNQATRKVDYVNIPYGSMIYEPYPHDLSIEQLQSYSGLARTHIAYHPVYERLFRESFIKAVFVYRDPRDLLVSYYFWTRKQEHRGQSIPGLIDEVGDYLDAADPFLEMMEFWGEHIRRYIPWIFVPETVLPIKYEDLINKRLETFGRIEAFWDGFFGSAEEMVHRINPTHSPVFRKGIVGDWVNHFQQHHIDKFNEILGDVLDVLGYTR